MSPFAIVNKVAYCMFKPAKSGKNGKTISCRICKIHKCVHICACEKYMAPVICLLRPLAWLQVKKLKTSLKFIVSLFQKLCGKVKQLAVLRNKQSTWYLLGPIFRSVLIHIMCSAVEINHQAGVCGL